MELDGMIQTTCAPEKVAQLLLVPAALRILMPVGSDVGERAGETVPFVLRRRVGPINLSMAGSLTLRTLAPGKGYELVILASHMVAGRIRATLALTATSGPKEQRLAWTGKLEAHGLAGRMIEGRAARVRSIIRDLFLDLREQAERA